jgi:hypothetical protein
MAKKRSKQKSEVQKVEEVGKVGLQVRLDAQVHKRLVDEAEHLGVSLNRLISDICTACSRSMIRGRLVKDADLWCLAKNEQVGYLTFGHAASVMHDEHGECFVHDAGSAEPHNIVRRGNQWFYLDFTETANIHGVE